MNETELRSSRLPLGPPGHWLHLMEAGPLDEDAPTILLLHGAAGSWHNWYLQIRSLSTQYRIVVPDLRGHGLSPWPGPNHVDDFYADLVELVRLKMPSKFIVMGHSFGGYLAARLAAEYGARVTHLALLNTAGNLPRGLVYRAVQLFCGHVEWWTRYHPYNFSVSNRVAQEVLFKTVKGWDAWALLATIACPTLVVLGNYDMLVPVGASKRMAEALPHGKVRVINGGGHVSMWESPRLLLGWLQEFLNADE